MFSEWRELLRVCQRYDRLTVSTESQLGDVPIRRAAASMMLHTNSSLEWIRTVFASDSSTLIIRSRIALREARPDYTNCGTVIGCEFATSPSHSFVCKLASQPREYQVSERENAR